MKKFLRVLGLIMILAGVAVVIAINLKGFWYPRLELLAQYWGILIASLAVSFGGLGLFVISCK